MSNITNLENQNNPQAQLQNDNNIKQSFIDNVESAKQYFNSVIKDPSKLANDIKSTAKDFDEELKNTIKDSVRGYVISKYTDQDTIQNLGQIGIALGGMAISTTARKTPVGRAVDTILSNSNIKNIAISAGASAGILLAAKGCGGGKSSEDDIWSPYRDKPHPDPRTEAEHEYLDDLLLIPK